MKRLTILLILLMAGPVLADSGTAILECTTTKAATICVADVHVKPLSDVQAAPLAKVCFQRLITRSESPRGLLVQDHRCGTVGIYNPTLKPRTGTVVIYYDHR